MKLLNKETAQNLTLLLVFTLLTLFFVEVGFRIAAYKEEVRITYVLGEGAKPEKGKKVELGEMVRTGDDPGVIYEFIPDIFVNFKEVDVEINQAGFRGKGYPEEKAPGTLRIFGIGDSEMFGWGVEGHQAYMSILSDSLNNAYPACQWEIINSGVPGYNTMLEVEVLKQKGLAYQPDYVIVGYVENDFRLPIFISNDRDYYSTKESFMLDYIRESQVMNILSKSERIEYEMDNYFKDVPSQYKYMVGEEGVRNALRELRELSLKHNFKVIVFLDKRNKKPNEKTDFLPLLCQELGFYYLSFYEPWMRYVKQHAISDPDKVVRLEEIDAHPSVIGHQAMAEGLFHFMQSEIINQGKISCSN